MSGTCDLCDNDYTHSLSCPRGDLRELPYDTVFTASMARRIESAFGMEPSAVDGEPLPAWWNRVAVPQGFMPYTEWKATDNGTVSGVMVNALIRMAIGRGS